jgi:hypothetical protein
LEVARTGDFNGNLFWPVLYRTLQTALEAAPTLLCGLVLAGLIRGLIKPELLHRWFTNDPRIGPLRACAIGFLLPVCSFGVLPVAWELRRAGVARATVLTFLLTAPLANPISLASALQKLGGQGVFAINAYLGLLLGACAFLAGVGVLLGRWLHEAASSSPDLPSLPQDVFRRLIIVALTPARGLTGILALFLIVGLIGSGLLALYPGGALEQAANDRSIYAPLHMGLAALPAQIPPEKGSMLLCEMLLTKVSFGMALVFLVLGIGMNLGTLVWIAWVYGSRFAACAIPPVLVVTLLLGHLLPFSLPNLPPDAAKGRHFLEIESKSGAEIAKTRALEDTLINEKGEKQWFEIGACAALAALIFAGIVCRVIGEKATPRYQMSRSAQPLTAAPGSNWSKPVSAPHLALAGLVVGLILVVGGLYFVYPSPAAVLEEMNGIQIELNLTLKTEPLARLNALQLVAQWQRLQSKLVFGDFLRRGRFNSPLRQPSEELRLGTQKLRTALIEMTSTDELNALYGEARSAATRCRQAVGQ